MSHALPVLMAATALLMAGCSQNGDAPRKALTGATLMDGTGKPAIPNAVVVIDGTNIVAAGPEATTKIPDGFEKINVAGKFIVPGLIDAHVLIDKDKAAAPSQLRGFVAAGITSIGADGTGVEGGPHIFPSLGKQAGIADLVIASNGTGPEATLGKIERMAKAEIPPVEIIQAATHNAAAWLGQAGLGAIQPGQKADLVVLNADPGASIKNLRQVYRVMLDGHWVNLK